MAKSAKSHATLVHLDVVIIILISGKQTLVGHCASICILVLKLQRNLLRRSLLQGDDTVVIGALLLLISKYLRKFVYILSQGLVPYTYLHISLMQIFLKVFRCKYVFQLGQIL